MSINSYLSGIVITCHQSAIKNYLLLCDLAKDIPTDKYYTY